MKDIVWNKRSSFINLILDACVKLDADEIHVNTYDRVYFGEAVSRLIIDIRLDLLVYLLEDLYIMENEHLANLYFNDDRCGKSVKVFGNKDVDRNSVFIVGKKDVVFINI